MILAGPMMTVGGQSLPGNRINGLTINGIKMRGIGMTMENGLEINGIKEINGPEINSNHSKEQSCNYHHRQLPHLDHHQVYHNNNNNQTNQ